MNRSTAPAWVLDLARGPWFGVGVEQALVAAVGALGVLAGVVATAWFDRRNAADARYREDLLRLRDQRRDSLASFAQSLVELRRLALRRWHEVHDAAAADPSADPDLTPSTEAYRVARNAAWGELDRLRLVWDDPETVGAAESLLLRASRLGRIRDRQAMVAEADQVRADLGSLADQARGRLAPRVPGTPGSDIGETGPR